MRRTLVGVIGMLMLFLLAGCTREGSSATFQKEFQVVKLEEKSGNYWADTNYIGAMDEDQYRRTYDPSFSQQMGYSSNLLKVRSGNITRYQLSKELYEELLADQNHRTESIKEIYYVGQINNTKLLSVEKKKSRVYDENYKRLKAPYVNEFSYGISSSIITRVNEIPLEITVDLEQEALAHMSQYDISLDGNDDTEVFFSSDSGQNGIVKNRVDGSVLFYILYGDVVFSDNGRFAVYFDPAYGAVNPVKVTGKKGYLVPGFTIPEQSELTTNQWLEAYYPTADTCPYKDILAMIPSLTKYQWSKGYPTSDGILYLEEGSKDVEENGKVLKLEKDVAGTTPDGLSVMLKAGTIVHPKRIDTGKETFIFTTESDKVEITASCEKGVIREESQ